MEGPPGLTNGRTGMLQPQSMIPKSEIPTQYSKYLFSCSGNFFIMDLDDVSN